MAEFVDSCCVSSSMTGQLTKPDKNNNTTANVDDGIILPSEQSDVVEDGIDGKSECTGDSDDRRLSSGGDEERNNNNNNNDNDNINNTTTVPSETTTTTVASSSSSNDEIEVPINNETTVNNSNTSTNNTNTTDPYKDFSGVDTESFIATTLRNNPKDRTLLLTLETVLHQFIQNDEQTSYQFQAMNSYERMIVHRVAAFFGLDHNVDKNGQAVVVSKTANTRIPSFSFQKCIPEDETNDTISGASTTENPIVSTNINEIPTRRILRRHEKHPNHEHSQRNGFNDEYSTHQTSTTSKNQPSSKPYSERVNHYAETRARIFNETNDSSNMSVTNKNFKTNQKQQQQHSNFIRPSYRKQQQQQHQNNSHQHRSYAYQHAQQTTNNHMQQYPTGKTIDPSSHMLNTATNRTPSMYSAQQAPVPQPTIYAPMITSNPATASLRPPTATTYYTQPQQAPVDYDYKQQTGGGHIYNYLSMVPPTTSNFIHQQQQPLPQTQQLHPQQAQSTSATAPNQVPPQHGAGIPLQILLQQPTGQIQYIFPAHALQQQQPPPSSGNPYPLTPDGQFVPIYRQDALSIPGPPTIPPPAAGVVDTNNTHHHHHHPYSQNQPYHHHQISQQQQQQQVAPPPQQQQQQIPSSQSNAAPQPPPFVRLYSTGPPGNVSHPYAQASYQPHPSQTTFVQPSFMIPPAQTTGGVQTYPTFDNNIQYNNYVPAPPTVTGKTNLNNNGTSVQYATNHLSTLTLQNQHDEYQTRLPQTRFPHSNGATTASTNNPQRNFMGRPLVQSPNGTTNPPRMAIYSTSNQQYRQNRPINISNTDKQITSIENDPKSSTSTQQQQQQTNSDNNNISLAGPAQD